MYWYSSKKIEVNHWDLFPTQTAKNLDGEYSLLLLQNIFEQARYVSMWKQRVARAPVRAKKEAALVSCSISEARNSGNGKYGLTVFWSDDVHLFLTVHQYHFETRSTI